MYPLKTVCVGSLLLILTTHGAWAQKRSKGATTAKDQIAFGVEMAQRGLWSEALFRFRQAERLDASNASLLNNLAVTHEALGLFEEALAYYQKASQLDPSNRSLKRNYARFVEFYQSFKPREEPEEAAEASEDGEGVQTKPPGTTREDGS